LTTFITYFFNVVLCSWTEDRNTKHTVTNHKGSVFNTNTIKNSHIQFFVYNVLAVLNMFLYNWEITWKILVILVFYHSWPLKKAISYAWCTRSVWEALYSPYNLCYPAISLPKDGDINFRRNPENIYQPITIPGPLQPIIYANFFENKTISSIGFVKCP